MIRAPGISNVVDRIGLDVKQISFGVIYAAYGYLLVAIIITLNEHFGILILQKGDEFAVGSSQGINMAEIPAFGAGAFLIFQSTGHTIQLALESRMFALGPCLVGMGDDQGSENRAYDN